MEKEIIAIIFLVLVLFILGMSVLRIFLEILRFNVAEVEKEKIENDLLLKLELEKQRREETTIKDNREYVFDKNSYGARYKEKGE